MTNTNPTPYPELNHVLGEFTQSLQWTLGSNLIAFYLQGSFAVGDADAYSDVDVLMVIEREINAEEVAALQAMHAKVYDLDSEWAKHLEGSYFPLEILTNYSRIGEPLWYLDNGSRQLIRSNHCNQLVERWVVREHGIPLIGPAAHTLLEPVPTADLREEVRTTMREWGAELLADWERWNNRWYQAFVVLSYCRMLHTLAMGRVHSKRAGAIWAQATLNQDWADLIRRALEERPDPWAKVHQPADQADLEQTARFIEFALGRINVGSW